MQIPLYVPKWAEELARAVAIAALGGAMAAIVLSIQTQGVPDTEEKWTAIVVAALAGASSAAYAAFRAGLNKTSLTPPETPLSPPETPSAPAPPAPMP